MASDMITDFQICRDRKTFMLCTGKDFRMQNLIDSTAVMYKVGNHVRAGVLAGSNVAMLSDGEMVRVWDDAQKREVSILQGKTDCGKVQRILVGQKIVVVVNETGLVLYDMPKLSIYGSAKIPLGTASLCDIDCEGTILVRPGRCDGALHIEPLSGTNPEAGVYEVQAHQHPLRIVRLRDDGKLVATASTRGTLVRVFDVVSSNLVAEFRCGAYADDVHSLEFDSTGTLLLVGCGRTIHVFSLASTAELSTDVKPALDNSHSLGRYVPFAPSYFSSTWSARQYNFDKYSSAQFDGGFSCCFTHDNSHIVVLTRAGTRHLFPFLNTGQLAPADVRPTSSSYI